MKIKVMFTFDYDPATNECQVVGKPEIVNEVPKKKVSVSENPEPEIVLLDSKYLLNAAARNLLDVGAGDRINIQYVNLPDNPNVKVPVIGSSTSWGLELGNKLTKSSTVSYRGVANTVLAEYGNVYKLEEFKDGLFIMKGDKPTEVDDNISIGEFSEIEEEPAIDLDLSDLEDEDENYEISNIDFKFEEQ